jgi:hypothetical protein
MRFPEAGHGLTLKGHGNAPSDDGDKQQEEENPLDGIRTKVFA